MLPSIRCSGWRENSHIGGRKSKLVTLTKNEMIALETTSLSISIISVVKIGITFAAFRVDTNNIEKSLWICLKKSVKKDQEKTNVA